MFRSSPLLRDWVCWAGAGDGVYSIKSFIKAFYSTSQVDPKWCRVVWLGLAPPKVELFCWVVRKRIPVRTELSKRGVQLSPACLCPLCGCAQETVSHLLFSCYVSWSIWMKFLSLWGLSCAFHKEPDCFLLAWREVRFLLPIDSIWYLIPFTVLWTIWLIRNDIIFGNCHLDTTQLFLLAKCRLAYWFKANNLDVYISLDALIADPSIVDKLDPVSCRNIPLSWKAPPVGFIKLNVDGAVSRNDLSGGIGGLFHNCEGEYVAFFSESISPGPPILAELLAIKFGLELHAQLGQLAPFRLIIESDSKLAIEWILSSVNYPDCFKTLVTDIDKTIRRKNAIL